VSDFSAQAIYYMKHPTIQRPKQLLPLRRVIVEEPALGLTHADMALAMLGAIMIFTLINNGFWVVITPL
jgi:hypothetical protein